MIDDDALKKVDEFGLSVDVVAAHIASYCYNHPTETASEAVQGLTGEGAEVAPTTNAG